jgi:hypothetical protein
MSRFSYDSDYVNKTMRVTSVDIPKRDFESLARKNDIREVFKRLFITNDPDSWDWGRVALEKVNKDQINNSINTIKKATDNFDKIYRYPFKGPGEVLLYLILNGAQLMPDKDAEVDMKVYNDKYQIKSYKTSEEVVKDLRISGLEISNTANKLMALKESVGLSRGKGVSKTEIDFIKKTRLDQFNDIEKEFREHIYKEYFQKVKFIFLDSSALNVRAIRDVQEEDIIIQRYESGIIRPTIKISDNKVIE